MTVNWYQLFEIKGVCLIAKGDGGWVLGKERNVNFYMSDDYMSDDWDKATINKNLEQLIIPQPSVLHKVMHRGRSTQRLAASSRQNHCSHCGQPGHRKSQGSRITCPTHLQSHQQASEQAAPSKENYATLQLFFQIA